MRAPAEEVRMRTLQDHGAKLGMPAGRSVVMIKDAAEAGGKK
jgi:hypothetical protein